MELTNCHYRLVTVLKYGGSHPVGPKTVTGKPGHLAQHPGHQGRESSVTLYLRSSGSYELILMEKGSSVGHWKQGETRCRSHYKVLLYLTGRFEHIRLLKWPGSHIHLWVLTTVCGLFDEHHQMHTFTWIFHLAIVK